MANSMVSMTPVLAFDAVIAARSDPAPLSAVVVTVRVAARADAATTSRGRSGEFASRLLGLRGARILQRGGIPKPAVCRCDREILACADVSPTCRCHECGDL